METTVQQYFDKYGSLYGSAKPTVAEIGLYRGLAKAYGSVALLREAIEEGMEILPESEDIRHLFLQSALLHGCSVAGNIDTDVREDKNGRTYKDTIWSYITKNRAYRFIEMLMIKNHRQDLLEDWQGTFEKRGFEMGTLEPTLTRPTSLHHRNGGNPLIVGIEKPVCYFPSQLLRTLEGIRLMKEHIVEVPNGSGGKKMDILSNTAIDLRNKALGENKTKKVEFVDNDAFTFYWENLEESVLESQTLNEVAANTAIQVAEHLKRNGLNDRTTALIITKGYSPSGPIKEHGLIQDVLRIWDAILIKMRERDIPLCESLRQSFIRSLKEL